MDLPKPEEFTNRPDKDKELSRDSYLSPAFSRHGGECSWGGGLCEIADVLVRTTISTRHFSLHGLPGALQVFGNRADLYKTDQTRCWGASHT